MLSANSCTGRLILNLDNYAKNEVSLVRVRLIKTVVVIVTPIFLAIDLVICAALTATIILPIKNRQHLINLAATVAAIVILPLLFIAHLFNYYPVEVLSFSRGFITNQTPYLEFIFSAKYIEKFPQLSAAEHRAFKYRSIDILCEVSNLKQKAFIRAISYLSNDIRHKDGIGALKRIYKNFSIFTLVDQYFKVLKNELPSVRAILDVMDVNRQHPKTKKTALMLACEAQDGILIRELIERGADTTLVDSEGKSARDYFHGLKEGTGIERKALQDLMFRGLGECEWVDLINYCILAQPEFLNEILSYLIFRLRKPALDLDKLHDLIIKLVDAGATIDNNILIPGRDFDANPEYVEGQPFCPDKDYAQKIKPILLLLIEKFPDWEIPIHFALSLSAVQVEEAAVQFFKDMAVEFAEHRSTVPTLSSPYFNTKLVSSSYRQDIVNLYFIVSKAQFERFNIPPPLVKIIADYACNETAQDAYPDDLVPSKIYQIMVTKNSLENSKKVLFAMSPQNYNEYQIDSLFQQFYRELVDAYQKRLRFNLDPVRDYNQSIESFNKQVVLACIKSMRVQQQP